MSRIPWLISFALFAASCTGSAAEEVAVAVDDAVVASAPSTTTVPTTTSTTTTTTMTTTTTTSTSTIPIPVGVPDPKPSQPAPEAQLVDGFSGVGVVTIAAGGADLYEDLDGGMFVTAREGLVFAAQRMEGDWIEVFTTCDATAWVHSSTVLAQPPTSGGEVGAGFDLADATIVLDPGHGGSWNTGAASPSGLAEKGVNADIAWRVRDLLSQPRSVDWATGVIYVGDEIPAAGWVLVTRVGDGEAADYEAGLIYRSNLANAANADAMVAIHNNAGWEIQTEIPGSDVYYQSQIPDSRRFAKIMVEELLRSFASFEADWVGAIESGAKSRLSPREGNLQYYGILRRSEMPSVIAEGAYIANQSEADLLATPEFRQAYADAVYRSLVRFLTTDDVGGGHDTEPVIWEGDAGSGDARPTCVIPSQGDS